MITKLYCLLTFKQTVPSENNNLFINNAFGKKKITLNYYKLNFDRSFSSLWFKKASKTQPIQRPSAKLSWHWTNMFSKITLKSKDKNSRRKKIKKFSSPNHCPSKKDQTSRWPSRPLLDIQVDVLLVCLAPFTFITPTSLCARQRTWKQRLFWKAFPLIKGDRREKPRLIAHRKWAALILGVLAAPSALRALIRKQQRT